MIKGNDLKIKSGTQVVASSKSCTLDICSDVINTSSPTDGSWHSFLPGRKSWTVECSWLVTTTAALKDNILKVGSSVTLAVKDGDTTLLSGTAILKKCKVTATRGNLVQGSFSWQGTGALS